MSYEIDQLKLSEQIISLAKKISVTAGLYIFLTFIIISIIYSFGLVSLIGSPDEFIKLSDQKIAEEFIMANTTQIMVLNMIATILLHYFFGGIYGMIKKVSTQPYAGLGSAFTTIFSTNGLKALNVIILIQVLSTALSYILEWAGFALVGLGISFLLQFLTYFAVPGIYIHNLNVTKSVTLSIQTVNQKPGFLFAFITFTYLLSFVGILFFGIGIVLTLPLNYIVAYSLYKHITAQQV